MPISAALRTCNGWENTFQGSRGYSGIKTRTVSFTVFPILQTQHTIRNFVTSEISALLGDGTFRWLVGIKPSHLVYQCGDDCYLKPYLLCRFARQFGYDQLYVGNPNSQLGCTGSLIDDARAWRYFIVRCTGARFCMLH